MTRKLAGTNDEIIERIVAELQRLARNGEAPSTRSWDERRRADMPCTHNIRKHLRTSYAELVELAGLQIASRSPRQRSEMAATLDSNVQRGAAIAPWSDRYTSSLPVMPTPTRVEVISGVTLDGQPCRIIREYRMVR